jgi:DNA repair exonuclease SbcCD ATPase subunit
MLKIKKVEIEGFRGFTQKTSFEFNNPVTLLYGGNHQGKSSVLNAIEWCLYGDECIGEKSRIRERVGTGDMAWRVINDNWEKAQVILRIESEQGHYVITRAEAKGKGKKGKSIEITLPDETEKEGDEAELEIARVLRVSFKDFATTIYQHQETIHDIVIQKPSEQSDVMDRLLGLSDYRNILDGIRKSDILKVQRDITQEFNRFQTRLQEGIKIRQKDMDEKRIKVKEKGLREDELSENKMVELAESTAKDISNFATNLGFPKAFITPLSDWKNTQSFTTNLKKECNRLWAESPDVKEQSEKQKKRIVISSLRSQYETQYQNFKSKEEEFRTFELENGNQNEIGNKIRKVVEEIGSIDKEIKRISPKAKLIEEGVYILQLASPSEINICPLCGKEKPNLLEHLKKELEEKIKNQVEDLNKQKIELDKKKANLERLKNEHARLSGDIQIEKRRLKKIIDDVSEFLQKVLTDKDDPVSILSLEEKSITSRLKEIEEAIKKKISKIDEITVKIDTMNLLYDILLLKNKLEEINKIQDTVEYKEEEKIRTDISELVGNIEELSRIIRLCMLEEAKEKIDSATNAIDYYFRKITNNLAIQSLSIKVEEDKKTGGNFYIFEDQEGKRPIPILSQGDLNSLALSIFLGLAKTSGDFHHLGFILMDDPSQSLDMEEKSQLVEVLNEISNIKNIIVSTMDSELQKVLKEGITKVKTIYNFADWAPDSGPRIFKEI